MIAQIHESNGDTVVSQFSVDIKIFVIEIHCKFTWLHTILCRFLVQVLRTNLILYLMNTAPHALPWQPDE